MYPKKGPEQLWEAMANERTEMGGKIIFKLKINSIEIKDKKIVKLRTINIDGKTLEYKNIKNCILLNAD